MQWIIENIEQTADSTYSTVAWRVTDGAATAYGTVGVENLTLDENTTEQAVVEKVKHALNATVEQRDENGHLIPPRPDAKSRTDEIEAAVAAQAHELAHPKVKSVDLPWKAA